MTNKKAVQVQILRTEGCGCAPKAVSALQAAAEELGITLIWEEIIIRTSSEAVQFRFPGSPTLRINGQDLEPAARGNTIFGLA